MTPGVEVVVVAFGAPELLDACLGALEGTLPVVVVDNSSRADVRAVSERHGTRYVDPGRNLGFAGGVNVGLAHRGLATDDVLLLNPDARVAPGDVDRLQRCLRATPRLACVAPARWTDPAAVTIGWAGRSPPRSGPGWRRSVSGPCAGGSTS